MIIDFFYPHSLNQVLEIIQTNPDAKFIAGGTDLIPNFKQKNVKASAFIDVKSIPELTKIVETNEEVSIGAALTLYEIEKSEVVKKYFEILIGSAKSIASPVIRKSATIGGNVLCENRCVFYNQSEWWRESIGNCLKCNGDICIATGGKKNCFSKHSSDLSPALLVCNAKVKIVNKKGIQLLDLEKIYSGDGIKPHYLNNDDLVVSFHLPKIKRKFFYFKLRQRESIDFSSLTIAMSYENNSKTLRIALGSVDPKPILWIYSKNSEQTFEDFVKTNIKKVRIVDNDYYSREYRKNILLKKIHSAYSQIL
ncbi:MAG TPA: FAD binding domain-containing protein [Bacteroidia bacterium]|nr:FAD binding domain-containing protein [Bacteroidia bacterium]